MMDLQMMDKRKNWTVMLQQKDQNYLWLKLVFCWMNMTWFWSKLKITITSLYVFMSTGPIPFTEKNIAYDLTISAVTQH
jgi:hypothetical protein